MQRVLCDFAVFLFLQLISAHFPLLALEGSFPLPEEPLPIPDCPASQDDPKEPVACLKKGKTQETQSDDKPCEPLILLGAPVTDSQFHTDLFVRASPEHER
jgi:hypothetical protein